MSDRPPAEGAPGEAGSPSAVGGDLLRGDGAPGAAEAFVVAVRLLEAGRPRDARERLARALAVEPEDPDLRQLHATARLDDGDADGAVQEAGRLIADLPDWARPYEIAARGHLDRERWASARDAAREAVSREPEGEEGLLLLGHAELGAGRPGGAIEAGRALLRHHPESVAGHVLLGDAELAVDEPLRALGHYDVALSLDPQTGHAHNNRGVALGRLGREEEAQRAFVAAARLDPSLGEARENYAGTVRSALMGRWLVPSGGILIVLGALRLGTPPYDGASHGAGQLVLGVVMLTVGLVRARRREARLEPLERRVVAGDRWWQRWQIATWRPWFLLGPRWAWPAFWFLLSALVVWAECTIPESRVPWWGLTGLIGITLLTWWRAWRHYAPRWRAARARRR